MQFIVSINETFFNILFDIQIRPDEKFPSVKPYQSEEDLVNYLKSQLSEVAQKKGEWSKIIVNCIKIPWECNGLLYVIMDSVKQ